MNKEHMKALNDAYSQIESAMSIVTDVRDEQQESFDAKSEKWQESEAGQTFSEGLDALNAIIDGMDNVLADMSGAMEV